MRILKWRVVTYTTYTRSSGQSAGGVRQGEGVTSVALTRNCSVSGIRGDLFFWVVLLPDVHRCIWSMVGVHTVFLYV